MPSGETRARLGVPDTVSVCRTCRYSSNTTTSVSAGSVPGRTARQTAVCLATANRSHLRPLSAGLAPGSFIGTAAMRPVDTLRYNSCPGARVSLAAGTASAVSERALTVYVTAAGRRTAGPAGASRGFFEGDNFQGGPGLPPRP